MTQSLSNDELLAAIERLAAIQRQPLPYGQFPDGNINSSLMALTGELTRRATLISIPVTQ